MEKCPDCLSKCPWCGSYRWQVRDRGCGSTLAGREWMSCRKSKKLKGKACPKCGHQPGHSEAADMAETAEPAE